MLDEAEFELECLGCDEALKVRVISMMHGMPGLLQTLTTFEELDRQPKQNYKCYIED